VVKTTSPGFTVKGKSEGAAAFSVAHTLYSGYSYSYFTNISDKS
jgi:hypothetical protein